MLYAIQMHGEPGSGKTTLAREIGRELGAIVLELDVITAALIRAGMAVPPPGTAAYDIHYSIASSLLAQGHSVVLDNPVYRAFVEERSVAVAQEAGALWAMIECVCLDDVEVRRRLRQRSRHEHQATAPPDWRSLDGTREPDSDRLFVDTTRPLAESVADALRYVAHR